MNINEITWTVGQFGADLEAEINGHRVELWLDNIDGTVHPEIVVDGKFTTANTPDWSKIEDVFPREYWPAPMFRGQKFEGKPRLAPKALVDAIAAYQAELDQSDD